MSDFQPVIRRRPRWAHVGWAALLAVLAPTLIWIGRSSAGPAAAVHPAIVSKSFANIPTGRSDAVDAVDIPCTVSPNYTDMPGMSVTFRLGGTKPKPVIVLLQAQWYLPNEGVTVRVRLEIDGQVTGPSEVLLAERPTGVALIDSTHGFDFISDPLQPGAHTAKIQWHDNGVNFGCATNRTLIVMHK